MRIYYAYIFPHIKYGIEVYGACPTYLLNKLQATQTRILKILLHLKRRDSASAMFRKHEILNCKQIYELYLSMFVYKQQNNLLPLVFKDFFLCNIQKGRRLTRQSNDIYIDRYRTTQGQKTIKFKGGKLWNGLPDYLKTCPSLNIFKSQCKKYILRE